MKKILIILSLIASVSLIGCSDDKTTDVKQKVAVGLTQESKVSDLAGSTLDETVTDSDKASLQKENAKLKQRVDDLEGLVKNHDTAKDLLNESFKVLAAMDSKDFNYLKTIAGPNVKITENSVKIVTDEYGEINFLNIPMNELQYTGFSQYDGKFQIDLTRESKKGNIELYSFDFVKVDNKWKYNGHFINR